jgi:hypothetical protein
MRIAILAAVAAAAVVAGPAQAADPGLWIKTSQQTKPAYYRQGIASNPTTGDVFYSGSFAGLYRTRGGKEIVSNTTPIPKDVTDREQYNHIGDIAFDTAENGRLLLPLESYQPFKPDTNPSKTGSIGVMDATTLKWKYYVKLDPTEIPKTQWVATDPADGLVWTISGQDLLAYNLSDLNPANAAPDAAPIHSVRRLPGAAPNGAGGAVVLGGRIYLSTQVGKIDQLVSVDLATGASRVEAELPGTQEPEGLDVGPYAGGLLHWEMVPGGGLSSTQVVNLLPKGARLTLKLAHARFSAKRKQTVVGTVRVLTNGFSIPLAGVQLRLATHGAKTNGNGTVKLAVRLGAGRYRAQAFYPGLRTATKPVTVSG